MSLDNPFVAKEVPEATPAVESVVERPEEGKPVPAPKKVKRPLDAATKMLIASAALGGLGLGYLMAFNDASLAFIFGALVGLFAAAWLANPWLKYRMYNNLGLGGASYKGFLFIFYKGLRVDKKTFDIRNDTMELDERIYLIRPEHVYKVDGVPCAFAVADNSSTIPMFVKPDDKEIGTKWQDPKQLFAYITKMKNLIEARLARDKNKFLTIATYVAAGASILALLLLYVIMTNSEQAMSIGLSTHDLVNATYTKVSTLVR